MPTSGIQRGPVAAEYFPLDVLAELLLLLGRMHFEILGPIRDSGTIATGSGIRELARLYRTHGRALWRKRKGSATVQLVGGAVRHAEIHWYEAHGIGKVEFKIKRYLD